MADKMTPEQTLLIDALQQHGYDDWFHAILCAAIQKNQKDMAQAVKDAEQAFAANPKDTSTPQPDDADKLFGKPPDKPGV